jgi:hypothetical protein
MSDLTADEQALLLIGGFIPMDVLIAQLKNRVPEIKDITIADGKIAFHLEPEGKRHLLFRLQLSNTPVTMKVHGEVKSLRYRPELIASADEINGYVFVIQDAIQKGGAA